MPAVRWRVSGLLSFDGDLATKPPDREFGEVEQRVGRGEGHAIVRTDATRQAALLEQTLKGSKSKGFAGGFQSFTEQEIARGVIGDRQRVTIFFVAQQELAFVVGAP